MLMQYISKIVITWIKFEKSKIFMAKKKKKKWKKILKKCTKTYADNYFAADETNKPNQTKPNQTKLFANELRFAFVWFL